MGTMACHMFPTWESATCFVYINESTVRYKLQQAINNNVHLKVGEVTFQKTQLVYERSFWLSQLLQPKTLFLVPT